MLLTFYDFPAEHWRAHPDDEPDRVGVLDGAAAARQDEGEREPVGVPDDGLQADGESASKKWRALNGSTAPGRDLRGEVRRRDRGEARRLNPPVHNN